MKKKSQVLKLWLFVQIALWRINYQKILVDLSKIQRIIQASFNSKIKKIFLKKEQIKMTFPCLSLKIKQMIMP